MNVKLPLKKKLWILREIEAGKDLTPKAIARRHGLHQASIYKLWRKRHEIRSKADQCSR